jgi:hypothetical protein
MIAPDRKLHRIAERSAPPYPHPCSGDQPKLLQAMVQVLSFGVSDDDPGFSWQKAIERNFIYFRHFLQSPIS